MPGPRLVSRPWLGGGVRRVSFKPNCYQFGSCHVQGHQDKQMVSFGNLLIISRPRPPKWRTGYHAGIVLDPRHPKIVQMHFQPFPLEWCAFVMTLHSKWLSTRNGFGKTPKGHMGPSPQGRRRRPWVPWVPLGPLGPLVPPSPGIVTL